MRHKLNWRLLVALHDLYKNKKTSAKISNEPYVVNFLLAPRIVKPRLGNNKILEAKKEYEDFYKKYFLDDFNQYSSFFKNNSIPCTGIQDYQEEEIEMLIELKKQVDNGDLDHIVQQIEEQGGESYHGVSLMFTKDEKYLDIGKDSLRNALKIILQTKIPSFKYVNEKDQQYMYKLMHPDPKCIVLCENLDFLRKPKKPRENRIELWYAGGRNIKKLGYEPPRKVPIFYSCDWDWDGLDIFKLVKEKLPEIKLLTPKSKSINRKETPKHNSEWKISETDTGLMKLDDSLFDENQKELINELLKTNSWIREEDNFLYLTEMTKDALFSIQN